MIDQIPFFTEFIILGIVLGFGYGFTKLFLGHSKEKNKIRRSEAKKKQENSLEDELDSYINNAPAIAQKIQAELNYLKENNATPEQMKSLESKLELLQKVQQYEPIIKIAGKPLLKKVLSIIDKV
jgi:hypothetical protein